MPADQSLVYYWASIGFSAAGVVVFLWLLRAPKAPDPKPGIGNREPSDQRERDGRGTPRSTRSGIDPERSSSDRAPEKLESEN